MKICPKCQHENNNSSKFCEECGFQFVENSNACPACGGEVETFAKFCPNCGYKFTNRIKEALPQPTDIEVFEYEPKGNGFIIESLKKKSLKKIVIPNSVIEIEEFAFNNSEAKHVFIPNSVKKIGNYAFEYCYDLEDIVLPDSIKELPENVFEDCTNLKNVEIPNSVRKIGEYAFEGCSSLETIIIPDSVIEIGHSAFQKCTSLKSIEIPNSVKRLGDYAFWGCTELKNVKLSSQLRGIENCTFWECSKLEEINIPNSVIKIGMSAFSECSSLKSVSIPASTEIDEYSSFDDTTHIIRRNEWSNNDFSEETDNNSEEYEEYIDEADETTEDKIKNIVDKYIYDINKSNTGYNFAAINNPEYSKVIINAMKNISKVKPQSQLYGFVDVTLIGKGRAGLLFTDDTLYLKETGGSIILPYDAITEMYIKDNCLYFKNSKDCGFGLLNLDEVYISGISYNLTALKACLEEIIEVI